MDRMFDDLYKDLVGLIAIVAVLAAVIGVALWETGKFLIHHIHVFWR